MKKSISGKVLVVLFSLALLVIASGCPKASAPPAAPDTSGAMPDEMPPDEAPPVAAPPDDATKDAGLDDSLLMEMPPMPSPAPPPAGAPPASGGGMPGSDSSGFLGAITFVTMSPSGGVRRLEPGDRIGQKDMVKALFTVSRPCYVYVLQAKSDGSVFVLCPNTRIFMDNPVDADTDYSTPRGSEWASASGPPGVEQLYFIASYRPISELDALFSGEGSVRDAHSTLNEFDRVFTNFGNPTAMMNVDPLGMEGINYRKAGAIVGDGTYNLDVSGGEYSVKHDVLRGPGVIGYHIVLELSGDDTI